MLRVGGKHQSCVVEWSRFVFHAFVINSNKVQRISVSVNYGDNKEEASLSDSDLYKILARYLINRTLGEVVQVFVLKQLPYPVICLIFHSIKSALIENTPPFSK